MTEQQKKYRNPVPTVDIIIKWKDEGIILIERKNPPYGWAIPGGFVDYSESLENAAIREAAEETNLNVTLEKQFHTYSDPERDPRFHTITTVYIGTANNEYKAGDDAGGIGLFKKDNLPSNIVFDHADILKDFFEEKY